MKMIGKPRGVPDAPKAAVVEAAVQLLVAVGSDNKAGRRLLSDLLSTTCYNEKLLGELDAKLRELPDLEKRKIELLEIEARADKKLAEIERIRSSFDAYQSTLKAGT